MIKVHKCKQWIWQNIFYPIEHITFVSKMNLVSLHWSHDRILIMSNIHIWIILIMTITWTPSPPQLVSDKLQSQHCWIDEVEKVSLKQKISSSTSSWFFFFSCFCLQTKYKIVSVFLSATNYQVYWSKPKSKIKAILYIDKLWLYA